MKWPNKDKNNNPVDLSKYFSIEDALDALTMPPEAAEFLSMVLSLGDSRLVHSDDKVPSIALYGPSCVDHILLGFDSTVRIFFKPKGMIEFKEQDNIHVSPHAVYQESDEEEKGV